MIEKKLIYMRKYFKYFQYFLCFVISAFQSIYSFKSLDSGDRIPGFGFKSPLFHLLSSAIMSITYALCASLSLCVKWR